MWKNKKRKYFLSLTAHFFDNKLNYHSILYAFRKFGKNHTSENIKNFIKKELGSDLMKKVSDKTRKIEFLIYIYKID